MGGVMQELKGFLGLDPHLPSNELPLTNYKHQRASHNTVSELGAAPCWRTACLVVLHVRMQQKTKERLQGKLSCRTSPRPVSAPLPATSCACTACSPAALGP